MAKSTIQIPFRGIIEIVADHDVGKTIAALQAVYPYSKTIFVDDDVKGDGTVRQMSSIDQTFEKYINIGDMRASLGEAPSPRDLLRKIVYPTIEEISSTKHDVIIWDTWRIVYQSARLYVEQNQAEFKNVVTWRGTSTMIQGLISKVARMIEQNQLNKLRNACDLLIITHHMKDNYQQNVIVGRIPESSATFSEVSNMRIWLRRNTRSKVPTMLFLKRPNIPAIAKGKMVFMNVVPMKIVPTPKDQSIWDAIQRYVENPIESREASAEETPTAEELAMITGTLSPEQKSFMLEMLRYSKQEEELVMEAASVADDVKTVAPASQEQPGSTPAKQATNDAPITAIQLLGRAKAEYGYEMPQVLEILGKSFGEVNSNYDVKYWDMIKAAASKKEASNDKKRSNKK